MRRLTAVLALPLLAAAGAAHAQENPTTPGAIPNPGSYQGSMELQRREHEQSQQYQQPSQPNYYAPQRAPGGYGGGGGYGGQRGNSKADLEAFQRGDYATAYRLTMPLAMRGDRIAQYNIGILYAKGLGLRQDDVQAAIWYRRAADQGWAQAANDLGLAYALGKGVPRDFVQSHVWLTRAAGWSLNARDRAQVLDNRRQVDEAMSPAQLAQAKALTGGGGPGRGRRGR